MTAKTSLTLPSNLQIANVAEVYPKAVLAAQSGKDVTLKAAEMVRIDTAGLQLLLALQAAVAANGKHLKWEKVSDELLQCVTLLGAKEALHFP